MPNVQLAEWAERITSTPVAGEPAAATRPRAERRRPCAKCGGTLQARKGDDGVIADACPDCRGVWLDAHELRRILGDSPRIEAAASLAARDTGPADLDLVRGDCPRCRTPLASLHIQGPRFAFHVEQCPTCQGLWFDENELAHFVADDLATVIRMAGKLEVD
jgi:Zn-finger nucleic acid-binding protein